MDNEKLVKAWHRRIIETCEGKLGRKLTPVENRRITAYGGFLALEAIEDLVNSIEGDELIDFLNSQTDQESGNAGEMSDNSKQMGQWIGIGIALGIAIGAAMGNVGVGIAIGIAIGAGIGTTMARGEEKQPPPDDDQSD